MNNGQRTTDNGQRRTEDGKAALAALTTDNGGDYASPLSVDRCRPSGVMIDDCCLLTEDY